MLTLAKPFFTPYDKRKHQPFFYFLFLKAKVATLSPLGELIGSLRS
ncbi:hypothetical protein NEOC65_001201 [Neochlamydia sp. AcF65]|nr:hypothetical protein [Neochlamydia sp. AcF65]